MSQPLPATYEFHLDMKQWVVALAAGVFLVLGGLSPELTDGVSPLVRWVCVAGGAACLLICAACLISKMGVSLDGDGFEVRDLRWRKRYRWSEVSDVTVVETHLRYATVRTLGFNVADRSHMHMLAERVYSRHEAISPMLTGDPSFACALMNAFRARALGLPPPQA